MKDNNEQYLDFDKDIPRTDFYFVWNNPEEKPSYKDIEKHADTWGFPNWLNLRRFK